MGLLNLRNALMAGRRLPYDAEVEYLECAGRESAFPYIDTGILGDSTTTFEANVYRNTTTTDECAIGSYGGGNRCWLSYFFSNQYYLGYGGRTSSNINAPSGSWLMEELRFEGNNAKLYANGSVVESVEITTFSTGQNLLIGAMNYSGTASFYFYGRFGAVKIYKSGVLVRDYIPVRKGAVGYLYDRVTRKLFGNAGTGDFILGPDVVPVEWLEGTGTQYIDTGVGYFADFEIKVKMRVSLSNITLYSGSYNRLERISAQLPYWRFRSNAGGTYDSTIPITELHTLAWRNGKIYSDGAEIYQLSKPYQNYEMYAFGTDTSAFPCVIYYLDLWDSNDTPVRKFRPVRVGTEGAMMDTLTRRIYRNAGTGAFTYGNDLKYPIPA